MTLRLFLLSLLQCSYCVFDTFKLLIARMIYSFITMAGPSQDCHADLDFVKICKVRFHNYVAIKGV